jgi:hypothetical protein
MKIRFRIKYLKGQSEPMNFPRYWPENIQVGDREEKGTTIDGNNITQRKLVQKQKIKCRTKMLL